MTHICVSRLTTIGSDYGLSPGRRQAIIWSNAGLLSIGSLGTNFSEISIKILTFSFKRMRFKVSSAKRRPFCLGLNVLKWINVIHFVSDIVNNIFIAEASDNDQLVNYWITENHLFICQIDGNHSFNLKYIWSAWILWTNLAISVWWNHTKSKGIISFFKTIQCVKLWQKVRTFSKGPRK